MIKTITSVFTALGLILTATPALADSVTVTNDNTANVTNSVSVSANSGGNASRGGRGGEGGEGGNASGSSADSYAVGGDGGHGGTGGTGGSITTGSAIGTAMVTTDVNTSETTIIDNGNDMNQYNETLWMNSRVGASRSEAYEFDKNYDESAANSHNENGASNYDNSASNASQSASEETENGTSSSESYSDSSSAMNDSTGAQNYAMSHASDWNVNTSESGSGSSAAEEHNDNEMYYTHTYVQSNDSVAVNNRNGATVANGVAVGAVSGGNESAGDRGGNGGEGGAASGSGAGSAHEGGYGEYGGNGGSGGSVSTGLSDSLATVVTVSGRTITRVTRN